MVERSMIIPGALTLVGTFLAFGFAGEPAVAIAGILLNVVGLLWIFALWSSETNSGRSR